MSITSAINLFRQLTLDESQSSNPSPLPLVNEACFDYLFIEMVAALRASSDATSTKSDQDPSLQESGTHQHSELGSRASTTGPTDTTRPSETDDNINEALYYKVEQVGYRVGQRLAERYSKDRPRLADTLDMVKFVCKDIWTKLFRKQIDNLKTNHRGVYILQDNKFKWLLRMSGDDGVVHATKRVAPYLWFPCGIIRGILANLGVDCTVTIKDTNLPQCTFQIKVVKPPV
ncbi:hypothetical protein H4R33_005590 [Dimargaris cristalligena]|uniref:NO signaling/Golgi transport ligand-binding domain-containing protein n=1 Tax=Dimargaris cristalligena TaxID=215637 RepID=A0A4P9ZMF2_9FUNG|nr:hypothetical protein H4R33_005590 [Dimargaris cristalligena]RKP34295.1 NO signaling/Golgi transport ligand-binding domain-containing protein [Dimargaris cristalligena]|eukprot:RKP34295.1 NO signaling/Golgi transport ligand-binding domain-containing protein [Dimargaris cristalligena]